MLAVWLSYLVILAPNSGILQISDQIAADRYSYMAMLGWVILAAAGLCRFCRTSSRARADGVGIVTLCLGPFLVLMTWYQCWTWHDPETLWNHALKYGAAGNFLAHTNLGDVLYRQGKLDEAAAHFNEALRLESRYAVTHNNLGVVLFHEGKLDEAVAQYSEALRLNPAYVEAHSNLGAALTVQGKVEEAAAHFAHALRLNPTSAAVHNNLAAIMASWPETKYRDGKRAVESATRACELTKWKKPEFLSTLAAAHAEAGDFDAAISSQTRALELLTDERQRDDFRSRLVLYQAKKPYRQPPPARARPKRGHDIEE